jgi:hypothetical protein
MRQAWFHTCGIRYNTTTVTKKYVREKIKMMLYKHALKDYDSLEIKQSQRYLEENKYYDKSMRQLLHISYGWGILVGTGTYAVAWMIYFILKWLRLIFGFTDNPQKTGEQR